MKKKLFVVLLGMFVAATVFLSNTKSAVSSDLIPARIDEHSIKETVSTIAGERNLADVTLDFDIVFPDGCHGPGYTEPARFFPVSQPFDEPSKRYIVFSELRKPPEGMSCTMVSKRQRISYTFEGIERGLENWQGFFLNNFHIQIQPHGSIRVTDRFPKK